MGANNHKSASLIVAILIAVVIFKYPHSDSPQTKAVTETETVKSAVSSLKKTSLNDEVVSAPSARSSAPSTTRAIAADSRVLLLEDFLKKWNPSEEFTIDIGPNQSPIVISSGHFLITKKDEAKFIEGWAAVNEIPIAQLLKINSEKQTTSFSEVGVYQQRFKSYDVENSEIKIFRRSSDERVYYISATMKPILQLDENVRVTKEQALQSLKDSVASERQLKVIKASDKPVVLNETTPQLCWKFTVALENPTEERRVYIAVTSGDTAHSTYTLEH